jgi:hypothetical protein
MQIRDILNKLNHLEEAPVNPYKDPAQKAKFDSLSDEDKEWLTKTVTDIDGNERPGAPDISDNGILARAPNKGKPKQDGAAGDKPKFEPDPTGLDGAAGDKPSKTPGPVQSASEPTSDNNGGSKANNDAGGLTGAGSAAAGAAVTQAVKDPNSKVAQQVNKELGTPTEANPEVEKLVTSLDAIDKFLKKYGFKVETITESVYNYYRANINDFLTPQEQMKNWSILAEDNGRQKLDEFLGMLASRMASRAMARQMARRMAARQARRMAARNAARMSARGSARRMARDIDPDLDMIPGKKKPWWQTGLGMAGIVGGGIMLAPVVKDLWKGLKDMFSSKDEQQPMMGQPGPEDPNKPKDPNDPNKDPSKDPNKDPNAPITPTDGGTGPIPREELVIFMKNMDVVQKFASDQAKVDALPETIKIRLTNTLKAVAEFKDAMPSK